MARKRMVSPEFWTDEKLGLMPVEARLLFMGLISNADDAGRLPGNTLLVKSMIFPYDTCSTNKVEDWIKLLHQHRLINRYNVNDQTYIQIINFTKHQNINRPTPSKIPAFEALTEDSLRTHGALTEDSLPIEEKRIEKKRREEKVARAENVLLTDIEYQSLIDKLGEQITVNMIDKLNLYKGSTGKKYQSDYMTILSWERKDREGQQTGPKSKADAIDQYFKEVDLSEQESSL